MRSVLWKNSIRILTTIVLVSLGCWMFYLNWLQWPVRFDSYTFSADEAERLKDFPRAQYAHGLNAWTRQDIEAAERFFTQAVSDDVLFIDGWLRLAETKAARAQKEKAQNILAFSIDLTKEVTRWKWSQMVLARELGLEELSSRHANHLLSLGVLKQDTLQFLHTQLSGDALAVVSVLDEQNLALYLDWLMNWSLVEESLEVWRAMTAISNPEKETALRLAHFLLYSKHIAESTDIWQKYMGVIGMTNPGFEAESTGRGFDWCYMKDSGLYEVTRVNHDTWEGDYALRVNFNGRENIDFLHIYQIFTVDPLSKCRLTYAWKSQGITTDRGPFIEVYGYDKKGLYQAGPMISGTRGWQQVSLEFDVPEGCRAAVVRLRRQPSFRFDSKIRGTVWLDGFRLEKIESDSQRVPSVMRAARFYRE